MIDGTDARAAGNNYVYDGAGRLTAAWAGPNAYSYVFAATGGCGSSAAAGANTNRTGITINGSTAATFCYDQADRLSAVTSTTAPFDAYTDTIGYDDHGNTTVLAGQEYVYDAADRHIATLTPNVATPTSSVSYQRDAFDRIVQRTETVNSVTTVTRYGYTSTGDTADVVLTSTNAVVQRVIPVAGGVTVTKPVTGTTTWSYPDLHGSIIATADGTGVKQGATTIYDPDGNLLTGPLPDNQHGNFDNTWLGGHQRPLEHAPGLRPVIEMGARIYDPVLGRFLSVDPIEAGTTTNDYAYIRDPINQTDLDGRWCRPKRLCNAVKSVGRRVVHVQRFVRNAPLTLPSWVVARYVLQKRCSVESGLQVVCNGGRKLPGRGGITIGNIFINNRDRPRDDAYLRHEGHHSTTYAVAGPMTAALWVQYEAPARVLSFLTGKDSACFNPIEIVANPSAANYEC